MIILDFALTLWEILFNILACLAAVLTGAFLGLVMCLVYRANKKQTKSDKIRQNNQFANKL
jgi:preprotein translocase subunit SecG